MIWASFLQNQISFTKIMNIGSLGNVVVNEKDISFHKKPEALLPVVFGKLQNSWCPGKKGHLWMGTI